MSLNEIVTIQPPAGESVGNFVAAIGGMSVTESWTRARYILFLYMRLFQNFPLEKSLSLRGIGQTSPEAGPIRRCVMMPGASRGCR
jgi:hypothetical protein